MTKHRAPNRITADQRQALIDFAAPGATTRKGSRIRAGNARLTVQGEYFVMDTDDRRPEHRHTLLVIATDVDRLNAHWRGYCERRAWRNQDQDKRP